MSYRLTVLKMGQAEVPGPEVYWMSHWGKWELLYFYMVLIEGNGITAVINTGPPEDLALLNRAWQTFAGPRCQFIRAEEEQPLKALAALGVVPEQVDFVLLTPLQLYATANIPLFPKATICFSKRGWIEDIMARPRWLHIPRPLCISDEVLKYLLFDAGDRVRLLEDEEEVFPGIHAWWAGTHHRSSMVYRIQTTSGAVSITDAAFKYPNLSGHFLGVGESLAEGDRAYRRILAESKHVLPLYDPEVLTRYPERAIS